MSTPPTDLPAAPAVGTDADFTHGCVRCGARIPADRAMCERCNPLGLPQPATSQVHGTIALGLFVAVVVLAIAAKLAVSGIGPFTGSVVAVSAEPPGLSVTVRVRNDGTKAGTTNCRVFDATSTGIGSTPTMMLSPVVEPGQVIEFTQLVTTLGMTERRLAADCR